MSELSDKLNRYIAEVDREATVRLFVDEKYFPRHPFPGRRYVAYVKGKEGVPTKTVEIITAREDELTQEEWLVVLAHEAGHIEQGRDIRERRPMPPPTELDADIRSLKWLAKWGGAPLLWEFGEHFIRRPWSKLPNPEDIKRIFAQINELRKGLVMAERS